MTGKYMKIYTYNEIVDRFGKDVADKAISTGAEPTSCVVDPLHEGLSLWAEAPIEIDGYRIRAYYYLTEEDEQNLDFLTGKRKQSLRLKNVYIKLIRVVHDTDKYILFIMRKNVK